MPNPDYVRVSDGREVQAFQFKRRGLSYDGPKLLPAAPFGDGYVVLPMEQHSIHRATQIKGKTRVVNDGDWVIVYRGHILDVVPDSKFRDDFRIR